MMKKYFVFMAVVALSVFFTSCAKAPKAELDAATAVLEQAKAAQADVYLGTEYLAIQDSINVINAEIEVQKSKMFGNFKHAKEKLAVVTAQSSELVSKTEARKVEIKSEVVAKSEAVANLMAENNNLVEKAPKGKEGKEAIEAIKSDLAAINASVAEVSGLLESGELLAAQTKVNAAQQKATEINTELNSVIEKYMRKR